MLTLLIIVVRGKVLDSRILYSGNSNSHIYVNMDTTEITVVSAASVGGCILLAMMYYYVKDYCTAKH